MKLVMLLALLGGTFGLKAQDLRFGLKGGVNYSIFANTDPSSTGFGFHVGALADLGFSDGLNLRAELLLSNRAIQNKSSFELFGVTTTVKANSMPLYLTIPVLYEYKTSGGLSFFGGPQLGLLLSNKVKTETTVGNGDPTTITSSGSGAKNGLNGFVFGVAVGAEYDLGDHFGMGLRYVRDLMPTSDFDNAENFYNAVQLSVNYKL